ncbi:hypothetical protein OAG36_00495 [bacterium]|nr:hypothetical protein [bacterium]
MPNVIDPMQFAKLCWPHVTFYKEQKDIIYSVRDNDETFVPAGNMLGKDFVTAFIVLWFFCSRTPCRVVTTSVDYEQLKGVLWGEIRRFLQTSKHKLPLLINHLELKQQNLKTGEIDGVSYLIGRTAFKGEGMLGHHATPKELPTGPKIPYTLFAADEASGVDDESYQKADTWAHRKLIIGNPYPCANFFFHGVKGGDLPRPSGKGFYRKVIKIKAADSPNVKFAQAQIDRGKEPTAEVIIPGVKSYEEYVKNRELWDEIRQCVGLDAEFYEGAEVLMFPPDWLNRAERLAIEFKDDHRGKTVLGVDPAEGGDNTCWAVVRETGLVKMVSKKTPDTTIITHDTLALMREYNIKPENVYMDRGGGGKQHADILRRQGYKIQTVAFGESVMPEKRRGIASLEKRKGFDEEKYTYKNRRAEMYGLTRLKIDPVYNESGFGIPAEYQELRRQLGLIPLLFDEEGRLFLLPKNRKPDMVNATKSNKLTLTEIIGHSPDEADALVLGVYGLQAKTVGYVVR